MRLCGYVSKYLSDQEKVFGGVGLDKGEIQGKEQVL